MSLPFRPDHAPREHDEPRYGERQGRGGTVAWTLAANHPEVVDRLAILNAAHPRR